MKVVDFKCLTNWDLVKKACNCTLNKYNQDITNEWKNRMLISEHSPIRALIFTWTWEDLPYFSSVHFTRHHNGIEHYVQSQRPAGESRKQRPQEEPVSHMCIANAQAIIQISRERLCGKADQTTRKAWRLVLDKMYDECPELDTVCNPKCIRFGFCSEPISCGCLENYSYIIDRDSYLRIER